MFRLEKWTIWFGEKKKVKRKKESDDKGYEFRCILQPLFLARFDSLQPELGEIDTKHIWNIVLDTTKNDME